LVHYRSLAFLVLFLGACQNTSQVSLKDQSPKEMYRSAYQDFQNKRFKKAMEGFLELEVLHPYSEEVQNARLLAGESALKLRQYDEGVAYLDNFARLHPASKDVQKALYWKCLCYYGACKHPSNDRTYAQHALESTDAYLKRFPQGSYHKDLLDKKEKLNQRLLEDDFQKALFYKKRQHYTAALHHLSDLDHKTKPGALHEKILYEITNCLQALSMHECTARMYKRMMSLYPRGLLTKKAQEQMSTFSTGKGFSEKNRTQPERTTSRTQKKR
jgi:outer membrane protein assembly factor BamD